LNEGEYSNSNNNNSNPPNNQQQNKQQHPQLPDNGEADEESIERRIVLSVQQQIFRMLQPKVEKVSVSWGSMSDNILQVPAEIFIRSGGKKLKMSWLNLIYVTVFRVR
jgi:hypothetical protein